MDWDSDYDMMVADLVQSPEWKELDKVLNINVISDDKEADDED